MASRIHGTLSANTVATATVTAPTKTLNLNTIWGPDTKVVSDGIKAVRVSIYATNAAHTGAGFFTIDGTVPTVSGNDTYLAISGNPGKVVHVGGLDEVVVKIISPGAFAYSVEVVD